MPRVTTYPSTSLFPGTSVFPDVVFDPNAIGDELYEAFAPLRERYGENADLQLMCQALGAMMQPVDDLVKDGPEGQPGWSQTLDLNRAKNEWLKWIGQWVGYIVPDKATTQTDEQWSVTERARIVSRSAHRRGTVDVLREVVQEHLNAPKTVIIQERFGATANLPHWITVSVFTSQIATSAAAAEAAARSQKAAGLKMIFNSLSGSDYATLLASQATYAVVLSKFVDYNEVLANPAKP